MNLRKFYLIMTSIISIFLFLVGSYMLNFISKMDVSEVSADSEVEENILTGILRPFVIGNDPVNFVFMVGDKWGANTDTIMLVNFNPNTDKLNIMSIPRDTKVDVPGMEIPKVNGLYAKKNGAKLLVDTLSKMFGVNIKYYVYLDIKTFRDIIDLLGGVEINVPVDMDYDDPIQNLHIHLKKGKQVLDGKKAEQYLRFRQPNEGGWTKEMRKYYDGSDLKRIEAQQNFIKELVRQKANIFYFSKINEIINIIYDNLETNITMNEIMKLVKNISNFKAENVSFFTLPGKTKNSGYSFFIYDEEETKKIMEEYFYAKGTFQDYSNKTDKKAGKTGTSSSASSSKTGNNNTKEDKDNNSDDNEKLDVTKDNPSNSDTNLEGTGQPIP
ncbi:MAG TPA: LCP family protein [Clostridiaceae bacterium]|nr:LCP family protein [Clostridiaceae bacterium]